MTGLCFLVEHEIVCLFGSLGPQFFVAHNELFWMLVQTLCVPESICLGVNPDTMHSKTHLSDIKPDTMHSRTHLSHSSSGTVFQSLFV